MVKKKLNQMVKKLLGLSPSAITFKCHFFILFLYALVFLYWYIKFNNLLNSFSLT